MGTVLSVDFVKGCLVERTDSPSYEAPAGPLVLVARLAPFMGIKHPERERVIDLMRQLEVTLELGEEQFIDSVLTPLFTIKRSDVYAIRRKEHFDEIEMALCSDHWVVDVMSILGSRARFKRLKDWVDQRAVAVLRECGVTGEESEAYVRATQVAHRLAFQILHPELIDQLPQHQLRIL